MLDVIFGGDTDSSLRRGLCLGNFDGVHRGHVKIINTLLDECAKLNLTSTVYTFDIHPGALLGRKPWQSLTSNEKKAEIIGALGADELYFEHFDKAYAAISPESFAKDILKDKMNAKLVVVGDNYSFGHRGEGNAQLLKVLGEKYGFRVIVVDCLKETLSDGTETVISTTVLKKLISEGRAEDYEKLAGRPFSVSAEVVTGKKRGRKMSFPTVNILPQKGQIIPKSGVYATLVSVDGTDYRGITNVGNNPTFGDVEQTVTETNLLGFSGDLYGRKLEVRFISRIRDEKKFDSPAELAAQIAEDRKAREMTDR